MSKRKTNEPLAIAREHRYIAWYEEGRCLVNLAGSYDYLESAYYASLDLVSAGKDVHPTCTEMLDAYVPPLFLEKAKLAGQPIPSHYISNGYFEPPVIIDPINPFMIRSRVVIKSGREQSIARSMTRNLTYAICCQEIPPGGRVVYFRSILGWSTSARFRELSRSIWNVFRIPLARVRVIVSAGGELLMSDISQLPFERLGPREYAHLMESVQWHE